MNHCICLGICNSHGYIIKQGITYIFYLVLSKILLTRDVLHDKRCWFVFKCFFERNPKCIWLVRYLYFVKLYDSRLFQDSTKRKCIFVCNLVFHDPCKWHRNFMPITIPTISKDLATRSDWWDIYVTVSIAEAAARLSLRTQLDLVYLKPTITGLLA